jgi:AcrR family transcriptional regulator
VRCTLGRMARARARTPAPPVHDDVRTAVLAAAVRLIGEGGLAKLSMREVARAAGVSHQAPYHYFQDRESILAALCEEGFTILAERLSKGRDPDATPIARFTALARIYLEFAFDHPAMFRLMFRPDMVDIERFPRAKACGDRAFAELIATVQDCIDAGLFPGRSQQGLVVLGWSLAHGLACLLLDGPLAMKVPDVAVAREPVITETLAVMQGLLESAVRAKPTKTNATSSRAAPKKRARR